MISRKKQFTYWLRNEAKDCGLVQPPLSAQKAVDFLQTYLLGEDWYIVNPVNCEQGNSQVVHEILMKYSPEYRKECGREQQRARIRRN